MVCFECGTPFPIPSAEEVSADDRTAKEAEGNEEHKFEQQEWPVPPIQELVELDMDFACVEGFSRPNGDAIRAFIEKRVSAEDLFAAWDFAARTWLHQLSKDLGGEARVQHSTHFHCVSDLQPGTTQTLITHAESVLSVIRSSLQTAAWTGYHGRHVLLFFSDQEDYYAYISFHHRDGPNPLSGGIFIGSGYAHVALPFVNLRSAEHTITHELVHNLVAHLRLPLWLNEGLAVVIERTIERRPFLLDQELVERHSRHWTEKTIQTFWAGTSFCIPVESNELSYRLAEILVTLLWEKGPAFIDFIKHADRRDAGQDAALSTLATDLGELVGGFLGPGTWRPQRKAITDLLAARRETKTTAETSGMYAHP